MGPGICTQMSLVMRLQDNPYANHPEQYLETNGKVVPTNQDHISEGINVATNKIADEN